MVDSNVVQRPATSWGSVICGWVATLGASVIFAPIVGGLLAAGGQRDGSDLAMAVPVVLGILLSYLVGGYVAGRMAGYRTSWHGMMTAFFSLLILLLVVLAGYMADRGVFAGSGVRSLADVVPGVREWSVSAFGDVLSFGAILGFLAAIFGGWLGGLLAPEHAVVATPGYRRGLPRREPVPHPLDRRRDGLRRDRVMPGFARKGGERVAEEHEVDRPVNEVRDGEPMRAEPRDVDDVHTEDVRRDRP